MCLSLEGPKWVWVREGSSQLKTYSGLQLNCPYLMSH